MMMLVVMVEMMALVMVRANVMRAVTMELARFWNIAEVAHVHARA